MSPPKFLKNLFEILKIYLVSSKFSIESLICRKDYIVHPYNCRSSLEFDKSKKC